MRKSTLVITILAVAAIGTTCLAVMPEQTATNSNYAELIAQGGPIMPILYLLSFIAFCLIFYYLLSLRIEVIAPSELKKQIQDALGKKDFELTERICREDNSPLAKIIEAGIHIVKKPNSTYHMLRDAIEDEGTRQGSFLWQRIQYLQDIAIISPMVGLLGTVFGMIHSFMGLNSEIATPRPTIIASGISMALITTAAGLLIGIPAMAVHAYFRGRVTRLLAELEGSCSEISRELTIKE